MCAQRRLPDIRDHGGRSIQLMRRLTGSRRLRAKGRADQAKGNLKQAGAKVKDALKH